MFLRVKLAISGFFNYLCTIHGGDLFSLENSESEFPILFIILDLN